MSNIEKIKAEIERRKKSLRAGICNDEAFTRKQKREMLVASEELTRLSRFIDSLPEVKPSRDLEEAANEYEKGYYDDCSAAKRAAYHAFIAGAYWQKEQMMKDAKEIITVQGSLMEPEFVKQRVIFLKED